VTTEEIWRAVPENPKYQVSNLGRVKGQYVEFLNPGRCSGGHLSVVIGKGNSRLVHHLVLEAFVGPKPEGLECRHLNGVHTDNRLENLAWGTRGDNIRDDKWHGKLRDGYRLRLEDVRDIKRRLAQGETQRSVAERYKVAPTTINAIARGVNHTDVCVAT